MQITIWPASPGWKVERVSAEGDGGPEKRGTRRGKRRWLRSPPSFAQNMQQEGRRQLPQTPGTPVPVRPYVGGGQQRP